MVAGVSQILDLDGQQTQSGSPIIWKCVNTVLPWTRLFGDINMKDICSILKLMSLFKLNFNIKRKSFEEILKK